MGACILDMTNNFDKLTRGIRTPFGSDGRCKDCMVFRNVACMCNMCIFGLCVCVRLVLGERSWGPNDAI